MRALLPEVDAVTNINMTLQRIFITSAIVASDFGDVLMITSEASLYLRTRFVFRNAVSTFRSSFRFQNTVFHSEFVVLLSERRLCFRILRSNFRMWFWFRNVVCISE